MAELVDYAQVLAAQPDSLTLRRGQTADVVLDRTRRLAWRFPRSADSCRHLPEQCATLVAVRKAGLPAPEVVGAEFSGGPGTAHVCMRLLVGVALGDAANLLSSTSALRLTADLASLLNRLWAATPEGLPASKRAWHQQWRDMEQRARKSLLPLLSGAAAAQALHDLQTAVTTASTSPTAFIHGDLGGENLLVQPEDGQLVGVLDWDTAGVGDPAVDLAALRATLPRSVWTLLVDRVDGSDSMLCRADAYSATFGLQEALLGVADGDTDAVHRGLSGYS